VIANGVERRSRFRSVCRLSGRATSVGGRREMVSASTGEAADRGVDRGKRISRTPEVI
jgi:hypothetical protein